MRTMILRCRRVTGPDEVNGGRRDYFFKLDLGRLGKFIGPEAMPPFEGDEGFVEVLPPMTRLKVLRQVDGDTAQTRDTTPEEDRDIHAYRKKRGPH